jgi:haloalkane dehalogenase
MDRILEIKGKKICYTDIGNGPVIVFIHGWMDSKKVYENIISILSKKYRCINIDLPGFGNSDVIKDVDIPTMSALIHRLIKKLRVEKINLIGHSLGAGVSIVYAKRHQNYINKMVLISPFVSYKQFSKITFYAIRYIIPNFITTKITSVLYKIFDIVNYIFYQKSINMEYVKKVEAEEVKDKAINAFNIAYQLSNIDLYKSLRKIRRDILIIYGMRDSLLSIKPLVPFFGVVNNIRLAIFEDVRHFLYTYNNRDLAEKIDLFFSSDNVQ